MLLYSGTYKNWYIDTAKLHNVVVLIYTSSDHNKVSFHRPKVYKTPWLRR